MTWLLSFPLTPFNGLQNSQSLAKPESYATLCCFLYKGRDIKYALHTGKSKARKVVRAAVKGASVTVTNTVTSCSTSSTFFCHIIVECVRTAERTILHVFLAPNGPRKGVQSAFLLLLICPSARPTSPYLTRTVHSTVTGQV